MRFTDRLPCDPGKRAPSPRGLRPAEPIRAWLACAKNALRTESAQETLQDYIYRRFFKAGVVVVLSVGCLWGAINLLQIAWGKSFLQLRLLPSIHAHAHAMVFGWVGMFVMGFAYQSFP